MRLSSAQSDLILAIVGFTVTLVVVAILIPMLFTYQQASVPSSVKTAFVVLQEFSSHQINASGFLAPNGILYIDLGRESSINVSSIQSIVGTLTLTNTTYSIILSNFVVKELDHVIEINVSKAAYTACKALDLPCNWSLGSAYIVLRNGVVIPVRILSYRTIEEFKIVSGSIPGASARLVTLIPFSYSEVDPANLTTLITHNIVDIGQLILSTTPPEIRILPKSEALEYLKLPTSSDPGKGMSSLYFTSQPYNSSCGYVLARVYRNVDLSYDAPIGSLYVLYGSSRNTYNILFTWNGYDGAGSLDLTVNGTTISLEDMCPNGFRVVIIDFDASKGVIKLRQKYYEIVCYWICWAPWLCWLDYCDYEYQWTSTVVPRPVFNPAKYLYLFNDFNEGYAVRSYLELEGHARIVEIFCRDTDIKQSSYAPYILLGSTVPGQGYGLLFTTEDVGDRGSISFDGTLISALYMDTDVIKDYAATVENFVEGNDEVVYWGQLDEDYSTSPLVLIFKNFNITNDKYVAVAISVSYRFEDDEGLDYAGVLEDRPILFVGLLDVNTSKIVSYTTLTFRELTRYEDTYPPLAEGQSVTIFVPLPSPKAVGRHIYEVFIAIQDPYARYYDFDTDKIYNALDFLLYIESVGVVLFR